MTRALTSLADTLAAIPDSARYLLARPGDTELPATVIQDREWLAGQIQLRGEIWGIDDRRILATLWWCSASTMLVTPGILAIATDGTCLSPRLEHIVIHHQSSSRFSGSHGTEAMPDDDLDAFAAELRSTLGTVIDQLGPYLPRPRPLWAIASDAIADRFLWAGQRTRQQGPATFYASRVITSIGAPMPQPRYVDVPPLPQGTTAEAAAQLRIQRNSCCLLYRVPRQSPCRSCPRVAKLSSQVHAG
jgi:ferric iron reductase protein FhuF